MARWSAASASCLSDDAGSAVCARAFATNSSDRRRASCTRCRHCSAVSAESGKFAESCAKQDADDATSDHATTNSGGQIFMTTASRVQADQASRPMTPSYLDLFLMRTTLNRNAKPASEALRNGVSAMRPKKVFAGAGRDARFEFAATDESSRMPLNRRGPHRPGIHFE
jgi:hypothetical protein